MRNSWTISTINMTYTGLQNYTNMMVDEHVIKIFKVVVVVVFLFMLSFDIFVPTIAYLLLLLGASTVKWTALDPCSRLSESDPKLCTTVEFYEIEYIWIYKAKQFMFTKKKFQTTHIYFRSQCKWWTSGWHWKNNCQKLVQSIITLHEVDEFSKKKLLWPQVYKEFKEYEKKSSSKYLRSWNLC